MHAPTPTRPVAPLGLPFAARVALDVAARTLKQEPRSIGQRDQHGVRALASLLLRETGASYPDVCLQLYGHRGHSTAIDAERRWRNTKTARDAVDAFRKLLHGEAAA